MLKLFKPKYTAIFTSALNTVLWLKHLIWQTHTHKQQAMIQIYMGAKTLIYYLHQDIFATNNLPDRMHIFSIIFVTLRIIKNYHLFGEESVLFVIHSFNSRALLQQRDPYIPCDGSICGLGCIPIVSLS